MEQTRLNFPATDVANLESSDTGQKTAAMCRALDELKAVDIAVLDVNGQTILADYFVIATGTSTTHINSLGEHVQEVMRERGFKGIRPEGNSDSLWIVLDYGDTILHILGEETREFYDLERLWADANITLWPEKTAA